MPTGMLRCFFLSLALFAFSVPAIAGEADVIKVEVESIGDGKFRFDVTIEHADDGWDHYANAWQVLSPDGKVLGTRELTHPHMEEMPFTRSKTIKVPEGVSQVTVRARDLVHGFGGKEITIDLPKK